MESFKNTMDENIKTYIEMRGAQWSQIMMMPYQFFIDDLSWKIKLEDDKRRNVEKAQRASSDQAFQALKNKNRG